MTTRTSAIHQIRSQLLEIDDRLDDLFGVDGAEDAIDEIGASVEEIRSQLESLDPDADSPDDDLFGALLDVHQAAVLAVERGDLAELAEMLRDDALRAVFDRWHRVREEAP